jgi:hypothetical protein
VAKTANFAACGQLISRFENFLFLLVWVLEGARGKKNHVILIK